MSGRVGPLVFVGPFEARLLAACRGVIVARFREGGHAPPRMLLDVLDDFEALAKDDAAERVASAKASAKLPQIEEFASAATCSWLTVKDVAAQAGVTERAVRMAAESGRHLDARKRSGDEGTWSIEATSANAYAERIKSRRERSAVA